MKHVLVVDDDLVSRKLICKILEGRMECDAAADGKEGLALYEKSLFARKPYDLVLLDVSMPEMDGIEFLKFLRAKEVDSGALVGEGVPVIMITAFKKPFIDAFKTGCTDYILKPVDDAVLLKKIDDILGSVQ